MGVYSSAIIIIGATKKQFGDKFATQDDSDGFYKDGEFISMDDAELEWSESRWDTEDPERIMYGFIYAITNIYEPAELDIDITEINELKQEFTELTGIEAHVLLSPLMM